MSIFPKLPFTRESWVLKLIINTLLACPFIRKILFNPESSIVPLEVMVGLYQEGPVQTATGSFSFDLKPKSLFSL